MTFGSSIAKSSLIYVCSIYISVVIFFFFFFRFQMPLWALEMLQGPGYCACGRGWEYSFTLKVQLVTGLRPFWC